MTTRRLLLISVAITLTFVQEQMLVMLPNIQLTVLLMFVFVSIFTWKEHMMYVLGYVLLDNMYMGGFNLFYLIPMLMAWSLIPLVYHTVLRRSNNEYVLGFAALLFGFVYGWIFIPFSMIQTGIDNFVVYFTADILFEVVMAVNGFVTIVWLYKPLMNVVDKLVGAQQLQTVKAYK